MWPADLMNRRQIRKHLMWTGPSVIASSWSALPILFVRGNVRRRILWRRNWRGFPVVLFLCHPFTFLFFHGPSRNFFHVVFFLLGVILLLSCFFLLCPNTPRPPPPPPNNASPSILLMSLFEFLDFFLGLSFPFVGGVRDTVGINEYHDVL